MECGDLGNDRKKGEKAEKTCIFERSRSNFNISLDLEERAKIIICYVLYNYFCICKLIESFITNQG